MNARVFGGVAAWTIGAATAIALSLLAISTLGDGIYAGRTRTWSGDDVARALAAASSDPAAASSDPAAAPSDPAAATAGSPHPGAQADAGPSPSRPAPAVSPSQTTGHTEAVASPGGTALAVCGAAGAYLTSWSPAQGYRVESVSRGPSRVASVTFASSRSLVVLRVGCTSGVPTAQVGTESEDDTEHEGDDHH
ncbi:hypothetical protein ACFSL4_11400 [Streptomyces caeni]|uniref:Flp pilus-assembly TadG-like N-terminal domain-containing protein n=1 Tax=Streptomyces caeni TaxID=2307231 RepID=A0ABW4IQL8_9ACTN